VINQNCITTACIQLTIQTSSLGKVETRLIHWK